MFFIKDAVILMCLVKNNLVYCLLLVFLLCLSSVSLAEDKTIDKVKIIYTSDMSEISSESTNGYAAMAYLLEQHRKQSTPLFFFFGGGSIGPSMLSTFDRGSHIIDLLNEIEPDVMATTKRDFSFFEDELSLRSYEAAFPFVASNIVKKQSTELLDGLSPYVITQQGDYKIGVVTTLSASAIAEYNLKLIDITDKVTSVKKHVAQLRKENVDLIVLLNSGQENDVISLLEDNTVDLIFQKDSHTSTRIEQEIPQHPRYIYLQTIDEGVLVDVSWASINHSSAKEIMIQSEHFHFNKIPKNGPVLAMVNEYENRLSDLLDEVIGITKVNIDTRRLSVRKKESVFGDLLTDSIREYTGADIAIINGGTIRGETQYSAQQTMSRRDITSELPYRSHVIVLEVTGKQLIAAIEHGLSGLESASGRFLQVSGIVIQYNSANEIGKRLISLKHQGKEIDPNKQYKVAMSDYLAKGGDDFAMFNGNKSINYSRQKNILISDIVINYIRESGVIKPKVNNRIIDLAVTSYTSSK